MKPNLIWHDARTSQPSTKSYNHYVVVFALPSKEVHNTMVMVGFAAFRPTDNYTNGVWENIRHSTGNPCSDGVVLFLDAEPHNTRYYKV